jgi:hypothetical protein
MRATRIAPKTCNDFIMGCSFKVDNRPLRAACYVP